MPAFCLEKCLLPSSSSSCSSEWLSHNKLGAAWSCHYHSLSWSFYLTCFSLTQEALRRKSDISCSFPWHRPWVCSTAEQWECMQRRHSPGAGRCEGGLKGGFGRRTAETWTELSSAVEYSKDPEWGSTFWELTGKLSCFTCFLHSSEEADSDWWSRCTFPVWSWIC